MQEINTGSLGGCIIDYILLIIKFGENKLQGIVGTFSTYFLELFFEVCLPLLES